MIAMLRARFEAVMERRADMLIGLIDAWLPAHGTLLDLGSGTGHVAERLGRGRSAAIVAADVTDMHVVGPAPVVLGDERLPFDDGRFSAALLLFMLGYPRDPATVLREAARVTHGAVIVVQTVYGNRVGYCWHRAREFVWTFVAFFVSKAIGYVPPGATFTMSARRFYTADALQRDVERAGLRVAAARSRAVLPGRSLSVTAWRLEPRARVDAS